MPTLNRNNSNWSAEERRKINENWEILETLSNQSQSGNNGLKQEVEQLKLDVSRNTTRVTIADQNANQAKTEVARVSGVANEAKQTADAVKTQLDQIVIESGNSNPEIVQARASYINLNDRLDTERDEISERLTRNVEALNLKTFKISDYPRLDSENDDTERFERVKALVQAAGGGIVELEANTTYTASSIRIVSLMTIVGKGKTSILKQADNTNGHFIQLQTDGVAQYSLLNFKVDGNSANQNTVNNALHLKGVDRGYDIRCIIKDLFIENVTGTGLLIEGRGENVIDNIQTLFCGVDGVFIGCADTWVSNISAGGSGRIGIYYASGNCRFVNCKAYINGRSDEGSGYGFYIVGYAGSFVACEAQENAADGFWIDGPSNSLTGCNSDANGLRSTDNTKIGNKYGYSIANRAIGCVVTGTAYDFRNLNVSNAPIQKSAVVIRGGSNNKVDVVSYAQELAEIDPSLRAMRMNNSLRVTHTTKDGVLYEFDSSNFFGKFAPLLDTSRFTITSSGDYNKVGKTAHVSLRVRIDTVNTSVASSGFAISLPLSGLTDAAYQFLSIQSRNLVTGTTNFLQGRVFNNYVQILDSNGGFLQTDRLQVGTEFYINGTYLVN